MLNKSFYSLIIFISLISCKSEYKFVLKTPKKIQVNKSLTISLSEKNDKKMDSVQFFIDSKKLKTKNSSLTISISKYKLGKHTISALVFYENKTKKVEKPVYFMADSAPILYTCKIINTYPHDPKAYTQGLEYHDGYLYESTGRKGSSSIRKVEIKTGKVLQQIDLDRKYFGEGITIFNHKIYQLTWQSGIGFIYDLATFKKLGSFNYKKSREGWGLTHNKTQLIKSDGTENIWFLNPDTLAEESYIEAYTNTQKVEELNELEYINGKIYANRWQLNSLIIIDPTSGKVDGVANLNSLKTEIEHEQVINDVDEVLNGIAYDKEHDRLFVTGKLWSKLYEIQLIKK
jgi:glutamine cyclotransferase